MKPLKLVFAAMLASSCAAGASDERLARVEEQTATFDAELDQVEARVRRVSDAWAGVQSVWEDVSTRYVAARDAYERATASAEHAAQTYEHAAKDWQAAQLRWELYQYAIQLAMEIDANRYRDARGSFSCEEVSTASYRRLLAASGMSLTGYDVDHIVPRSLGGADHPANYQILPSSENRSLGATWDLEKCSSAGRRECGEAMAVSSRCGSYRGPWF